MYKKKTCLIFVESMTRRSSIDHCRPHSVFWGIISTGKMGMKVDLFSTGKTQCRIFHQTFALLIYRDKVEDNSPTKPLKCWAAAIMEHKTRLMPELRIYKNNSIPSKKNPILKLPLFFIPYTARQKERQFQNWNFFGLNGVVLILS